MENRIKVLMGDIINLQVIKENIKVDLHIDAIVNPANNKLSPGGGLSGAIHAAAGPQLEEECLKLHGCKTGEVKITKGYNLPVKYIIHTVGPVWKGGNKNEEEQLGASYKNSLDIAVKYKIKTIAFPSISTGHFHYPVIKAAKVAMKSVISFLTSHDEIEKVYFIMRWDNFYIYDGALSAALAISKLSVE